MSEIVLYFLHGTFVLSFYIDVVLTLSIETSRTKPFDNWQVSIVCRDYAYGVFCFNSLFRLTARKSPNLSIAGNLWEEIHRSQSANNSENVTISWRCNILSLSMSTYKSMSVALYHGDKLVLYLSITHSSPSLIQWGHKDRDDVSKHRCLDCVLSRLFWRRSKVTGGFPSQKASNAENIFIWWRHHARRRYFVVVRAPCRKRPKHIM